MTLLLSGCSSDDSNSAGTGDSYFKININGTQYVDTDNFYSTGYGEQENCQSNGDIFLQQLGVVESSTMYLEAHLAHFQNVTEFDNSSINTFTGAKLTDRNSFYSGVITGGGEPDVCNFKYDLSIVYLDETSDEYLKLKSGAPKTHNVTSVTFVSEDASYKIYNVEGNFSGTLIKNGVDVSFTGDYKRRLDVLK